MRRAKDEQKDPSEYNVRRFRFSLYLSMTALTVLVTLGTVMYRNLEGWTWITSFYFTVSTLTTVGYGDLHPSSEMSRLFTALFIVVGVAVALAAMTLVGSNYLELMERRILRERWRLKQFRQDKKSDGPDEG